MARSKSDPWKMPDNDLWIKEWARIVALPQSKLGPWFTTGTGLTSTARFGKEPATPWEATVWVITRIEVTGNGTKMVHLAREADPKDVTARWAVDLKRLWIPLPKKRAPRKPSVKKERTNRFDREDPI